MVKKKSLFILLIFWAIGAQCQLSIYGSTGINFSNVSFSHDLFDSFESSPIKPLFLTGGVGIPISDKMHFTGEVSYSPNGYRVNYANDISYRYRGFNLQPGITYEINPVRFEAGGFLSVKTGEQIKDGDASWESPQFDTGESTNWGIYSGINLSLVKNIGLFTRYYWGLSAVSAITYTDFDGNPAGSQKEKIRNLQIGISLLLF